MEQELQMPSCLFGGPPVRDDLIKLGESQIGFMNIFARPLFEAVADILPAMRYAVEEILTNNSIWEKKIGDEKDRRKKRHPKFSLATWLRPSVSTQRPVRCLTAPKKSNLLIRLHFPRLLNSARRSQTRMRTVVVFQEDLYRAHYRTRVGHRP